MLSNTNEQILFLQNQVLKILKLKYIENVDEYPISLFAQIGPSKIRQ